MRVDECLRVYLKYALDLHKKSCLNRHLQDFNLYLIQNYTKRAFQR